MAAKLEKPLLEFVGGFPRVQCYRSSRRSTARGGST